MVAVLDYGAGNLTSVLLALEHLGAEVKICPDADAVAGADRIIFPGVGSAGSGMEQVRARGFDQVIVEAAKTDRPVLAICLGMQLLFEFSEEDGGVAGLGVLPGAVRKFSFADKSVKVPHMGWNPVRIAAPHALWKSIPDESAFYFVHSFYVESHDEKAIAGKTEYAGFTFTSAAARGNLFATQFHPERSGKTGLQLLKNFLNQEPKSCC